MESLYDFFKSTLQSYGYPILFIGVLLENAGIPVPGETVVLLAGFLASEPGGSYFDISVVIGLVFLAAVMGDNIGFWLGHRYARPRLQTGKRFLVLTPEVFRMAETYFVRYGGWTIFAARFITGLRVVGAVAAGTSGMHWSRFLIANALGALVWSTTISLLGYYFGSNLHLIERWIGRTGLIALAIVLLIGIPLAYRQFKRTRKSPAPPGSENRTTDSTENTDRAPVQ